MHRDKNKMEIVWRDMIQSEFIKLCFWFLCYN